MKVIRVSPESFERMVKCFGKSCQFVRLPSTNEKHIYTGLVMTNGAWVPWPQDLTDEEMKLYLELYGQPPDIFSPDFSERVKITQVIRNTDE